MGGRANMQTPLAEFLSDHFEDHVMNQTMDMPTIDIHLSRASLCAEQLIEIIRFYNPDTFPLTAPSMVRGIDSQYYSELNFKRTSMR